MHLMIDELHLMTCLGLHFPHLTGLAPFSGNKSIRHHCYMLHECVHTNLHPLLIDATMAALHRITLTSVSLHEPSTMRQLDDDNVEDEPITGRRVGLSSQKEPVRGCGRRTRDKSGAADDDFAKGALARCHRAASALASWRQGPAARRPGWPLVAEGRPSRRAPAGVGGGATAGGNGG